MATTDDPQDQRPQEVTLELPLEAGATTVAVAGEFNDWSIDSHQMRPREDGSFAITLTLEPGRAYQYRYWVDDQRWENDWSADAYVPNEYGGDNSLLDLRPGSPRLEHKTPVSSEPPSPGDEPAPVAAREDTKPKRAPAKKKAAADATAAPKKRGAKRPAAGEPTADAAPAPASSNGG